MSKKRRQNNMKGIGKRKWCWVAKQVAKGWRVSLVVGETDKTSSIGIDFASIEEVKKVCKGNIVVLEKQVITKRRVINNQ